MPLLKDEKAILLHLLAIFLEHHNGVAQFSHHSLADALVRIGSGRLRVDLSEGVDETSLELRLID